MDAKRARDRRRGALLAVIACTPIVLVGVADILFDPNPGPDIAVLRIVLLIVIGIVLFYVISSYAHYFRVERPQLRLERPDLESVDGMTQHLEHGDVPYLGTDGEIYFKKGPRHTEQAQDQRH